MGIFKRKIFKENKSYNISEALNILDILNGKGLMDSYTLEQDEKDNGKYKFIALEKSREKEERIRKNTAIKRSFYDRVNGNGEYRNIAITPSDSNQYRNQQSIAR